MSFPRCLLVVSPVLFLPALLGAQSYQWSPPNTGSVPGGANNTIPFWSQSATYQQIHDSETMGSVLFIKGLGMRPAGTRTVRGRDWDMRIKLGQTKVTAITASNTFATNLGSINTTMVFGTSTSWQKFSWKNFTASGTTPAFTIPFHTPYTYLSGLGNLCWEWRHKNATVYSIMSMDATTGNNQKGLTLPSSGTGCTATGRTSSATATMKAVQTRSPAYQRHLEIALANATSNANSIMALGLSSTSASIGWCAPVFTPLVLVPIKTDSNGSYKFTATLAKYAGSSPFDLYTQFGFTDAGLPGGIGLTNIAGFKSPAVPGVHGISRIWKSTYNSATNGEELATSGFSTRGYGLSIAWLK